MMPLEPTRPRCWGCVHIRPAFTTIDGKPLCRAHAAAELAEPKDVVIAPVSNRRTALEVRL
jgi:hypothetical protein